MNDYRRVLLATDFSEHSAAVTQRAQDLATRYAAVLLLVHVVETVPMPLYAYDAGVPFDYELNEALLEGAHKHLAELGEQLGVPDERRRVEVGGAASEIVRVAEAEHVDVIVVGSHGRRGLQLLLGSTATGVMHHAKCDVLAVRMRESG